MQPKQSFVKPKEDDLWTTAAAVQALDVERIPSGMKAVDDVLGGGIPVPGVILLAGNPGIGKCVTGDTVLTLEDGSFATIDSLAGKECGVFAFQSWNHKISAHAVSAWIDSGIKPVFRVTTKIGHVLKTTLNHPFWTTDGWRPLTELSPGTRIGVARRVSAEGNIDASSIAGIVGYLASKSNRKYRSQYQRELLEENIEYARKRVPAFEGLRDDEVVASVRSMYVIDTDDAEVINLEPLGTWSNHSLLLFFKAFFTSAKIVSNPTRIFSIRHDRRRHLVVIQSLLLRFGIVARIKYDWSKKWEITISDRPTLRRITAIFGPRDPSFIEKATDSSTEHSGVHDTVPIHQEDWKKFQERTGLTEREVYGKFGFNVARAFFHNRNKLIEIAEDCKDTELRDLVDHDVYWDEIESIEPMGDRQVYDISVPDCSSFIGNNFVLHNSTLLIGMVASNAEDSIYVTSEEAASSIGVRAQRLGYTNTDKIRIAATISMERTIKVIKKSKCRFGIIDSLQGLRNCSEQAEADYMKAMLNGEKIKPFRHTQASVRDIAMDLIALAHKEKIALFVVSHMNKGGDMSGVKEIEHMVDAAAFFSGDPNGFLRELRCRKNRFGGTAGIVGKMLMTKRGLIEATEENMELYAKQGKQELEIKVDSRPVGRKSRRVSSPDPDSS